MKDKHITDDEMQAWLDDLLLPANKKLLSQHLVSCPECQVRFDEYQALMAALPQALHLEPPQGFAERAMKQVVNRSGSRSEKSWLHWLAILAFAGVSIGGFELFRKSKQLPGVWPLIVNYVIPPVEQVVTVCSGVLKRLGFEPVTFGLVALILMILIVLDYSVTHWRHYIRILERRLTMVC